MKRIIFVLLIFTLKATSCYQWTVIGAGPAGIISVTELLENGVAPQEIIWIDPEFKVGRLGKFYGNVPSNQMAHRFTKFLTSSQIFKNISSNAIEKIKQYDQQQEPQLQLLVDALQDITDYLQQQVSCYKTTVQELRQKNEAWEVLLPNKKIISEKVILAHGSHPKNDLAYREKQIPLDSALDESKLRKLISKNDRILVIGSAHSALLIVKYLSELPVKQVISLYTSTPSYGRSGGLEGITARWTKNVLEKNPPKNLLRARYAKESFDSYAKEVDKIIFAHGYEKNQMIINGTELADYDVKTGVITKGLFGIGIAFPQLGKNKEGKTIPLIGVNSFMERAKKLIPEWIKS